MIINLSYQSGCEHGWAASTEYYALKDINTTEKLYITGKNPKEVLNKLGNQIQKRLNNLQKTTSRRYE